MNTAYLRACKLQLSCRNHVISLRQQGLDNECVDLRQSVNSVFAGIFTQSREQCQLSM